MVSNASTFILNRKDALAFTNNRIRHILSYVIECHRIFLTDNLTYSVSRINSDTKIKTEEYFRTKFVDNYLRKNRHLLESIQMDELFFGKEEVEIYQDNEGIEQEDKIDIYVREVSLQKYWSINEEVYFTVECKRIKKLSDTKEYIIDIEKFCNRKYINTRLPFEGQIAFIENPKLHHTVVVETINKKLLTSSTITTCSFLTGIKLHSIIQSSYISTHKKNFLPMEEFSIYHLMFDYSGVVVD